MVSKKWQDMGGLLAFVLLVTLTAALGSIFTRQGTMGWYATLAKPEWTPPAWLFGPVWTVLYILIAISGWLVWRRRGERHVMTPLAVYLIQLALNAGWSIVFFGMRRPDLAMVEIGFLLFSIVLTIAMFWRVSRYASLLLMPYLLWTSFATLLNYALWRLNAG